MKRSADQLTHVQAPAGSPWLEVPEVAEYARCGKNAVYTALQTGALNGRQSGRGGKWLVHRDQVDAWLSNPAPRSLRAYKARRSA